jgi:glycerol-3-phosphate cytidylyltransferase
MRIGYTTGVYDMFHVGHLNILRNARAQCDHLIVGVTTDEMSESRKGKRPVVPTAERMQIVESIRFVDQVVPQTSSDKMQAWRDHRFDVMFVGDDWKGTPTWDALEAEFAKLGVEIVYFPYTTHTSSTMLRRALGDRLEQAS